MMTSRSPLIKLVLILTLFGGLVVSIEFIAERFFFSGQTETIALENAKHKASERERLLNAFFERSSNVLYAISNSEIFHHFIHTPNEQNRAAFEQLILVVTDSLSDVMKVRYIDENGMEIVRADRDEVASNVRLVPNNELQDKSHRYFFSDSRTMEKNKIWFSDFDLNEDNGQVDTPFRPTLRAVMPLSFSGQFKGILIINYFTQPLFHKLLDTPLYNMIIADRQGDILFHYQETKNWSKYTQKNNIYSELPNFDALFENRTYQNHSIYSQVLTLPNKQQLVLILSLKGQYIDFEKALSDKKMLYTLSVTGIITLAFGVVVAIPLYRFFIAYGRKEADIDKLTTLNKRISRLLMKNQVYMEMASDGVHILDSEGNIIAFSQSFNTMLGYSNEEMSKMNVRDWDAEIPAEQIKSAMSQFGYEANQMRTRHRKKDGSLIDVEINAKWISTDEGELFYASSRDITDRLILEMELQRLANTDELTGLPTRRAFNYTLKSELERCQRDGGITSAVIMIDIDRFKSINDGYGHGVGDQVIKVIAAILKDEIRKIDGIGRLGGEEFGLILSGMDSTLAHHFTNSIRKKVAETTISISGATIHTSVSIGITEISANDTSIEEAIERADKALYRSKRGGRNRVEIFTLDESDTRRFTVENS